VALVPWVTACQKTELKGAEGEVQEVSYRTVELPQVPEFNEPKPYRDDTHPVREMRLKGNQYLNSSVKVKGYVVWIYDCATAVRTPEMSEEELKKLLKNEPERCDRPNFVVADEANHSPDKGIWVVEAPRPLRDDEKRLPPDERASREKAWKEMPKFGVGDQVTVTGKWDRSSPRGFHNSDGLLIYESMTAGTAAEGQKPSEGKSGGDKNKSKTAAGGPKGGAEATN
jgi:hypothetical protein